MSQFAGKTAVLVGELRVLGYLLPKRWAIKR